MNIKYGSSSILATTRRLRYVNKDIVLQETNVWKQKAMCGAIKIETHLHQHPLKSTEGVTQDGLDILNKKPKWLDSLGPVDVSTGEFVNKLDGDWLLAAAHSDVSDSGSDYDSSDLSEEEVESRAQVKKRSFSSTYQGWVSAPLPDEEARLSTQVANCGVDSEGFKLGKKAVVELNENGDIVGEWDSLTTAGNALRISRTEVAFLCTGKKERKGLILKYKYLLEEGKKQVENKEVSVSDAKAITLDKREAGDGISSESQAIVQATVQADDMQVEVTDYEGVNKEGSVKGPMQPTSESVRRKLGKRTARWWARSEKRHGGGDGTRGRYIPQVGDQVVYYQEAHREACKQPENKEKGDVGASAGVTMNTSDSEEVSANTEVKKEEVLEGYPPWFGLDGSPHAIDCTVTAVTVQYPADWTQKLYSRMDAVLLAGFRCLCICFTLSLFVIYT